MLNNCDECDNKISEKAYVCVNCGAPTKRNVSVMLPIFNAFFIIANIACGVLTAKSWIGRTIYDSIDFYQNLWVWAALSIITAIPIILIKIKAF